MIIIFTALFLFINQLTALPEKELHFILQCFNHSEHIQL